MKGLVFVERLHDVNDGIAVEDDEDGDDERIKRSWEENGVVLREREESEESNRDGDRDVSRVSKSMII